MTRLRWFPLMFVLTLAAAACVAASEDEPPAGTRTSPAAVASNGPSPSAASGRPGADAFVPDRVRVRLRRVVGGLDTPVLATAADDGSGRLFVLEQVGRVRVVANGRLLPGAFLDLTDRVVAGGEQGLLGLAFHPAYERNGRFFVDYTDTDGNTVVAEYRVSDDDANLADPASERVLLGIDQPYANHNGGHLAFGPDGYLYVATGDGGSAGDPMGNGQRIDTLLGKLLRIDVDARSGGPYGIPRDNPFVGREGARPEIWAYGLRNPWRFSFDRRTGDLWIGDVGQGGFEEIDHVAGDEPGVNFGWNVMEGRTCFEPSSGCDRSGLTLPVAVYDHGRGCSVTGGFVYRGARWPRLRRAYLYADYCSGTLWGFDAARPRPRPAVLLETDRSISSFGQDESGELYVVDHAAGEVLLVVGRAG